MRFSAAVLPLAVAGGVLANPLFERDDACAACVTGGSVDAGVRSSHCASFIKTTVYPVETSTCTVTGVQTKTVEPASCKPTAWKRDLTVCPSSIPTYATACSNSAAYSSACSIFGFTTGETATGTTTTSTQTSFTLPTGWSSVSGGFAAPSGPGPYCGSSEFTSTTTWSGSSSGSFTSAGPFGSSSTTSSGSTCSASTITSTVISTKFVNSTATATASCSASATPSTCLTDDDAETIVNGFIDFLEHTNNPTAGGFNTALAESLLADDFTDTSDSINFLANITLTTVTFASKDAFIGGQGSQPEIPSVVTLNLWHDCSSITWRWRAFFGATDAPVTGINYMIINAAKQIETNYSEFDNAAWLLNLGNPQCAASSAKLRREIGGHVRRSI